MAQEVEQRLKKNKFEKALRGYNCDDVDAYLAYVNDRYNTLVKEISELRRKLTVMAAGQNEYREDALRDKERIVSEAEALVRQKTKEAEELTARSQKKAASILQDAEKKAAEILQQAEAAAENILSAREAEKQALLQAEAERTLAAARQEAGEILSRQNRRADKLVAEMDSFRESVFALYSRHLEEMEKLAGDTDALYQHKEDMMAAAAAELGEDVLASDTDWQEETVAEEAPVREPEETTEDDEAVLPTDESYIPAAEEPADEWEDGDMPADPSAEQEDDQSADLFRIDWKNRKATTDTAAPEDETELWEDVPAYDVPADEEEEEPEDEPYDAEELFDDAAEDDEEEGADEETDGSGSEEDFLSGLASEYFTPASPKAPAGTPAAEAGPAKKTPAEAGGELEDLFYEEGEEISLTGEFDKIFSSKKSAANVTQISRQPLVPSQKPDKKAARHLAEKKDR